VSECDPNMSEIFILNSYESSNLSLSLSLSLSIYIYIYIYRIGRSLERMDT